MEEISSFSSIKSHPIVGTNPAKVYPEGELNTDSLIDDRSKVRKEGKAPLFIILPLFYRRW